MIEGGSSPKVVQVEQQAGQQAFGHHLGLLPPRFEGKQQAEQQTEDSEQMIPESMRRMIAPQTDSEQEMIHASMRRMIAPQTDSEQMIHASMRMIDSEQMVVGCLCRGFL